MNFQTSQTSLFVRPPEDRLLLKLPFISMIVRFKLVKVALKVFEKKIKKAQELEAEEAKRRLEASASVKEQAHG